MPSLDPTWLLDTLVLIPPLLFSLVIHEYAHARTAHAFGDDTARLMGRMTLNPLAHLDPIGTLCIILIHFGWAKPVPVNSANLHPRRLGDIAVSLAGPLSNLVLAVVTGILLRLWWTFGPRISPQFYAPVYGYLLLITSVNIILCTFNLLPLFPLDGHHVLRELLPARKQRPFMEWQLRFGSLVLMALLFGPRLLVMFTGRADIPDPLGWVFYHVRMLVLGLLGI
ncbi:MAG: site-2 protease family protein [Planctomycetes bacterium]|nr:site-2 protease family protein [Planctomycetota bacterium]